MPQSNCMNKFGYRYIFRFEKFILTFTEYVLENILEGDPKIHYVDNGTDFDYLIIFQNAEIKLIFKYINNKNLIMLTRLN